jgi:hypothetical protein
MSEVSMPVRYRVDIIESERGWGSKVDEVKYFDNEVEAKRFVKDYNEKWNKSDIVPDWYMVAEYVGLVK